MLFISKNQNECACEYHQSHRCNDQRAALKRQINTTTGSDLMEEKSYATY